ncbi:diguanylate cyclase [Bifidobacterium sp.]|jgi:dihydroorotate dehydrogenase|uniref:diguanylate cyclase n=1 Tax=Bifidobacterium sp. TaxID=41200 RepID=UPI0025BCD5C5|nr:diguanylate cyclase [Bifidobacterium sp.]MCI1636377.1 diguanylate cyclase [Bifidobacterium sp.]
MSSRTVEADRYTNENGSQQPFYDVRRSYEENYNEGPFGAFSQISASAVSDDSSVDTPYNFLGQQLRTPFGIPAGPLLNSAFTDAAFRMGFDICVYKTVRSRAWECNPFPNVLAVHPKSANGFLEAGSTESEEGVLADDHYERPISISNSFGVPSRDPDIWQPDMQKAIAHAGTGQLLIGSFQGSRLSGMDTKAYIQDHVDTAALLLETGAKVIEMNTSCPNEGKNKLLCDDPILVGQICEAVKNNIGDVPLIVKLAFIPDNRALNRLIEATVAHRVVQGLATINTISAKLVDAQGNQALPGEGRERSGVCGNAIRPSGLDMVTRLNDIRSQQHLDFSIVGVGGVLDARDFAQYRQAGADVVMSATGAMWDPNLAKSVSRSLRE